MPTFWKELIVGDIVIVQKDERIPADLVLISSEHKEGVAHLETSTLDGEKHLKPRTALYETQTAVQIELLPEQEVKSLKASQKYLHGIKSVKVDLEALVSVQQPQASIYKFEGFITLNPKPQEITHEANKVNPVSEMGPLQTKTVPLTIKNFIFKGTKIRNVAWVAGIVVYTGPHTKIQMNGAQTKSKISKLERLMHKLIVVMFIIQIVFSVLTSVGQIMLQSIYGSNFSFYFTLIQNTDSDSKAMTTILRFFVLLNTMIPISLVVNIEIVRLAQALFIAVNYELMSKERNM